MIPMTDREKEILAWARKQMGARILADYIDRCVAEEMTRRVEPSTKVIARLVSSLGVARMAIEQSSPLSAVIAENGPTVGEVIDRAIKLSESAWATDRNPQIGYLLSFLAILVRRAGGNLVVENLSEMAGINLGLTMELDKPKDRVILSTQ